MKETKFKQTEVGMIPSDWEVKTLGELFDFSAGGDLQKESFSEYPSGTIKWPIYSNSLENKGLYGYTSNPRYRANCVTITGRGSLGHAEYRREAFDAIVRLLVLSPKQHVDCYFVSETINFRVPFVFESTGVPQLTAPQAAKSKIPLPPTIEEQQRIASALSDVDTLIANLEKLIAKKKNIKQGAMQQLLTGKKRLPGFGSDERQKECHSERSAKREVEESSGYKMTELGLIPSDWEFVPVSELAKDMADGPFGSNLKKEHYTSDPQTRIIQLSNIGENGWEDENTKYTTFEHAKTIARCIVPKEESILVAKMMPAGRAIICPKKEKQYVLGSDVIRITANEKLNSKYFVYASKSDAYLKQISDNTQGSTRQRTSISKLRKILILLPSLAEQTAIANVLSDMDAEISALETKLAKYRTLKTGMMQQLLTGKVRLP